MRRPHGTGLNNQEDNRPVQGWRSRAEQLIKAERGGKDERADETADC